MRNLTFYTIFLTAFCALSFKSIQKHKVQKIDENLYAVPEGISFTEDEKKDIKNTLEKFYDLEDLNNKKITSLNVNFIKGASGPNWISDKRIGPTFFNKNIINYHNSQNVENMNLDELKKILEKYTR